MHKKFWKYNIYWLIWLCLISYLSNTKSDGIPKISFLNFKNADKLVHAVFYFNLVFLMIWGLRKQYKYLYFQYRAYFISIIFAIFWGGFMEIAQLTVFTYRNADWVDFLANSVGAFLGLWAFKILMSLNNNHKLEN